MVAVVQTAGDLGNWQPHVQAMASRGGWTRDWEWAPVPYIDERAAELLFRHKVMRLLQGESLLSEERSPASTPQTKIEECSLRELLGCVLVWR